MTPMRRCIVITLLLTTGAVAGASTPGAASTNFARKINVGNGRRMFLECRGTGSPTVVFESGYRNRGDVWSAQPEPGKTITTVEPAVAGFTRVCTYDRPGTTLGDNKTSRSDPVPNPRTAQDAVDDLHALLGAAKVPGPYVLVGHSMGGLFVRLYAAEHPDEVAGMVLVDSLPEQLEPLLSADDFDRYAALVDQVPKELAFYADKIETVDLRASYEQMRQAFAANPPGDIPYVVIARGRDLGLADDPPGFPKRVEDAWRTAQEQLAALAPNGKLVIAKKAGHYVQLEQPRVVIDAVRGAVDDVRASD